MSFIRTILGDIPAEEMGVTYSHEHIVIEECYVTLDHPEFLLNDSDKIVTELKGLKGLGCATMVDTMPVNAGRNVLKSAEISKQVDIHFIIPTGIHLEIYYPKSHWRYQYTEDQLTQLFIKDIEEGIDRLDYNGPVIDRTQHKAGLIKLATGDEPITRHQEKIFHAVVNAHKATGAPILTHTNNGNQAIAQAALFEKLGANLNHIVLSHVDRNKDIGYQMELMQTGISVEYDSAFRWKGTDENWTYVLLEKLLPLFPNQITVGMDAAKNTYWKSYNGKPGLDYLLTTFKEELSNRKLDAYTGNIFIKNPARIFSFEKFIQPLNH
ncbi:MAG: aryldialkylphosphatase [Ferruginibacter sp.]|nr:aryldialkylphosphatase [Ferruginibacter sp.]